MLLIMSLTPNAMDQYVRILFCLSQSFQLDNERIRWLSRLASLVNDLIDLHLFVQLVKKVFFLSCLSAINGPSHVTHPQ